MWRSAGLILLIITYSCSEFKEPNHETTMQKHTSGLPEIIRQVPLTYQLPEPSLKGSISVEEAMYARRSHRNYLKTALSPRQLSQMLWAAYGITRPDTSRPAFRGGFRTAPSAGATYPLEIYVVIGKVNDIKTGVYKYNADGHQLTMVIDDDVRQDLAEAALNQEMIADAPVSLVYSAIFDRTTERYGERGRLRYVPMDLGHSAQNVYLQAETLGLGTCAIGAFHDGKVSQVMHLPLEEEVLYIMPIGKYYRD